MAGRRTNVLDIREILRRVRLGESDRRIGRDLTVDRKTVAEYRAWAQALGFLDPGIELPGADVIAEKLKPLTPAPNTGPASAVEPYRAIVEDLLAKGVELAAMLGILRERGFKGSYSALRRFARRLRARNPEVFIRVETPPGQEAQVDFGYAGEIYDPVTQRLRKAWVFVMTLSYSRHMYAEIVFDQTVATWVALHVRAFEFFGGVVERVVVDNLKSAISRAVVHDAEAQRSYRELAEHYDFVIAPCRPRTPRHKGKVEKGGVHYTKRNGLAGRTFRDANEANAHLIRWIFETAGVRDHGTTHEKPLVRYERERPTLKPLAQSRYEIVVWKLAKVHPDCHVVFDYAYYSAPHRLVGKKVNLRTTPNRVEVHWEHERVATHPRATRRGEWRTIQDHLPPEKLQGLLPAAADLRERAAMIGASTSEVVERLLGDRPVDRLRSTQAVLGLARKFGTDRLEAACRRALAFNATGYHAIKGILQKQLDLEPLEDPASPAPLPRTAVFARRPSDFLPT